MPLLPPKVRSAGPALPTGPGRKMPAAPDPRQPPRPPPAAPRNANHPDRPDHAQQRTQTTPSTPTYLLRLRHYGPLRPTLSPTDDATAVGAGARRWEGSRERRGSGIAVALAGPGGYPRQESAISQDHVPPALRRPAFRSETGPEPAPRTFYANLGGNENSQPARRAKTAASSSTRRPRGPNELPASGGLPGGVRLTWSTPPVCRFSGFLEGPLTATINPAQPAGRQPGIREQDPGRTGGVPRDEPPALQGDLTSSSPNPGPRGAEAGDWHTAGCFQVGIFGHPVRLQVTPSVADPRPIPDLSVAAATAPAGSAGKGLGTGHWSVEAQPAVLTSA